MKKLLACLVVLFTVSCTKSGSNLVQSFVNKEKQTQVTVSTIMNGCVSKALTSQNPGLMVALMASGGRVCGQIAGEAIREALDGKSLCTGLSDSKKCLFTAGYVTTTAALDALPKTKEESEALSKEVDTAFEKFAQEQEAAKN